VVKPVNKEIPNKLSTRTINHHKSPRLKVVSRSNLHSKSKCCFSRVTMEKKFEAQQTKILPEAPEEGQ
jgi:hypothetical protein